MPAKADTPTGTGRLPTGDVGQGVVPPEAAASSRPPALQALFLRSGLSRALLARWTAILSSYFTAHGLVQLLGIATGLLFINFMPVEEFALYTLAFSVVSFLHFATDLGSTSSLVYFAREARRGSEDFRPYVAAVVSLRRAVFVLGGLAVAAGFPLLAGHRGFDVAESLLATAAIVIFVGLQIVAAVRVLVLRLESLFGQSYKAEVAGAAVRLALATAMVATALLYAWLGVLTAAAGAGIVALLAAAPDKATRARGTDLRPYRRKVQRYLLPTLPSALYFSVQAPLVVWLAATFGSTRSIAEVGAVGRLGMALTLFSGLVSVVFLPRMAGIGDDRLYRRRYFQYGALMLGLAVTLFLAATLWPHYFLFLLGPNYAGLRWELILVVGGAAFSLLNSYAAGINLARSWNRWQTPAVILLIATQAALVAVLPLGTTAGVLTFGLVSAGVGMTLQLAFNLLGFVRPVWVRWH